jgi:fatty-acyl-CoA synthase
MAEVNTATIPFASTMQDFPLSVTHLLRHGQQVYKRSRVLTFDGVGLIEATFAEVAERSERLAAALARLGVGAQDRVATLMWNTQEHLEAYLAVPSMGAVLHTLNLRLPPRQLVHIINTAADKVVLVHASLLQLFAAVAPHLTTVEHVVVVADPGTSLDEPLAPIAGLAGAPVGYEAALAAEQAGYPWPDIDERAPAAICFTSGTTGDPKGVVYSHRSTFLHALATGTGAGLHADDSDRVLPLVPMFHVNAWGLPYSAWSTGASLVMPHRHLQGEPLCRLIGLARPTLAAGVPTIWGSVLAYADEHPEVDLSSLRTLMSGGSALPASIIEGMRDRHGVRMTQGWGMTETSPVCTFGKPPADAGDDLLPWQLTAGRILPGVEMRIVTPAGEVAPWDGDTVGEIQVRGPWITGSYLGDPTPEKFDEGWLRTGDIGAIDDQGFVTISDRVKDVIKSGGEWISSVELENEVMNHPGVAEASVVGVPDERWGERPLAVVVRRPDSSVSPGELRSFLEDRVIRWWLPERWAFVAELPKTSVGKFDKKALRAAVAAGELQVERLATTGSTPGASASAPSSPSSSSASSPSTSSPSTSSASPSSSSPSPSSSSPSSASTSGVSTSGVSTSGVSTSGVAASSGVAAADAGEAR